MTRRILLVETKYKEDFQKIEAGPFLTLPFIPDKKEEATLS